MKTYTRRTSKYVQDENSGKGCISLENSGNDGERNDFRKGFRKQILWMPSALRKRTVTILCHVTVDPFINNKMRLKYSTYCLKMQLKLFQRETQQF